MLFWETLATSERAVSSLDSNGANGSPNQPPLARSKRLPFDKRCIARTKAGPRCRGRIYKDSEFCFFHDPATAEKRRRPTYSNKARRRRRLSHLPDGYLRKLTSLTAVGEAMDRLYREVRIGAVTVEMGEVMFAILTRLQDSDLVRRGPNPERSKAAHVRPKLKELLTRQERKAWKRAVDHAVNRTDSGPSKSKSVASLEPATAKSDKHPETEPAGLKLQVAS